MKTNLCEICHDETMNNKTICNDCKNIEELVFNVPTKEKGN